MPRFRPRISILNALFLMTIIAMAIVIVQFWREIGPLRTEVRQLRDETGELTIDDTTQLHAIAVRMPDEYSWKWRFWIPEGRKYLLKMATKDIPHNGFAKPDNETVMNKSGEMWVEFCIAKNANGEWIDSFRFPRSESTGRSGDWVAWPNKIHDVDGAVGYSTVVRRPDESVVLLRYRVSQAAELIADIEDPAAGFMIWLEPTK